MGKPAGAWTQTKRQPGGEQINSVQVAVRRNRKAAVPDRVADELGRASEAGALAFKEYDLGFYERLWPRNGISLACAFGLPDADYESLTGGRPFQLDDYGDKLILGWRYRFSKDAQILISVSQEASVRGFGGGSVQFQMFR